MVIICQYCNKEYSSYSSRSNHIKKYHTSDVANLSRNVSKKSDDLSKNVANCVTTSSPINKLPSNVCKYCNKQLCDRKYRWYHEKKCKYKDIENNSCEIIELKKEIEELKDILQKSLKIHPKQLQKINNELQNGNQFNNQGTININNTNNIQVVQLAQLGDENLLEVLSDKEILFILNNRAHGLREMIKLVHISDKYKQFKNVYITNLQNTIGYKYDAKSNNFIAVNKNELLDELIDCRMFKTC